jgi:hypothetical protein
VTVVLWAMAIGFVIATRAERHASMCWVIPFAGVVA